MSSLRKNSGDMRGVILILGMHIFLLAEATTNYGQKSSIEGDLNPIISLLCPANEPCWNSISDSSFSFGEAEIQEPRIQTIRGVNPTWQEAPEKAEVPEKVSLSIPVFPSRISKKDVFMSRGWAAAGLPFSVLYMNALNSRNNHGSSPGDTQKQPRASEVISGTGKNLQQNYRVTTRNNKPLNQTRRHFSIVPQLFISYGWGPHGN